MEQDFYAFRVTRARLYILFAEKNVTFLTYKNVNKKGQNKKFIFVVAAAVVSTPSAIISFSIFCLSTYLHVTLEISIHPCAHFCEKN
jgi:hypothetical protein